MQRLFASASSVILANIKMDTLVDLDSLEVRWSKLEIFVHAHPGLNYSACLLRIQNIMCLFYLKIMYIIVTRRESSYNCLLGDL